MEPTLQERQQATRQRLVDEAFELFHKRGFDNVTVEEIATAAGVSRRTFFRYFPSKEKVIFPFTERRIALFRQVMRDKTQGRRAKLDDVTSIFKGIVQSWYDSRERMLRGRQIVNQSESLKAYDLVVTAKWERALAQEIDGGNPAVGDSDPTPSLRSRIIAGVIVGSIRPVLDRWYECDGEFDLAEVGSHALDVAVGGLSSIKDDFDV